MCQGGPRAGRWRPAGGFRGAAGGRPGARAGRLAGDWADAEYRAQAWLRDHGLPVAAGHLVTDAAAAVSAAQALGGPVAMKVQAADFAHKSDYGLVLGRAGDAEVAAGYDQLMARAAAAGATDVDGVLVQAMAAPGVELLIGVHATPLLGRC